MGYRYEGNALFCEDCGLAAIAEGVGTPAYVYSRADIVSRYCEYDSAFGAAPHQVCYAVKANSNLSILRLLAGEGAGFDIVSGGELYRVLRAGGDPAKVVFSGVGKTAEEIEFGLREKIRAFRRSRRPPRNEGDYRTPRESGRGCRDSPVHLHRSERTQIRHRYR
jgi:diaminopimelate decarboxylase